MAGLYVHIPFCRKACVYCDFHFVTSLQRTGEMVDAILREAELRKDFLQRSTLQSGGLRSANSLYFGGGTPSVLSASDLDRLLIGLTNLYPLSPNSEITLEANPDDLSESYLKHLRQSGINRLSIGTQSFRDQDLIWMNRSHNGKQAIQSVQMAQDLGFENISLDLIFGIPGMDIVTWQDNLEQAISLEISHLSIYALTVEEKTALDYQLRKGSVHIPEDGVYKTQFLIAHHMLEAAGYNHYELSNYALPGQEAVHNSNYWNRIPYLGLGPSAHGFDGEIRYWNHANNSRYLKEISLDYLPTAGKELLSPIDHYHEYLMTHLRRACGIDPVFIHKNWMSDWEKHFSLILDRYLSQGLMQHQQGRYVLSPEGWIISDQITADFFLEE